MVSGAPCLDIPRVGVEKKGEHKKLKMGGSSLLGNHAVTDASATGAAGALGLVLAQQGLVRHLLVSQAVGGCPLCPLCPSCLG